jgi:SH3 domain protein
VRALGAAVAAAGAIAAAGVAAAEPAWVRAEIILNLRTGPGTQFRIVSTLHTGDRVEILDRGEKWTQVSLPSGKDGWIPGGYLQPEAPPTVRLGMLEEEVVQLRTQLETVTAERETLRESNTTLTSNDDTQRSDIESLTFENMRLRAGQRWPEWITGAGVLSVGMILGALLHRNSARRPGHQRIRL